LKVIDSTFKKRGDWQTLIVTFICLTGASAGGVLLYRDINEIGSKGTGKPLGTVEKRESKVRRKAGASYIWTNVNVNEELFLKDSIQTGPGSAAAVRLPDGSVLDVGEDSLVVMDDTANLSLNFLRGSVVVHNADGDKKISVDRDGKTQVEELSVKLISPPSLAHYFVLGKDLKSLRFEWQLRSKTLVDSFTFQLSRDKFFSAPNTESINTILEKNGGGDNRNQNVSTTLRAGKYYWRVMSQNRVITEVRQLSVLRAAPLQPIFPAQAQKIASLSPDTAVQFRWVNFRNVASDEADPSHGDHRIEVSQDSNFNNLIANESINPTTGLFSIHHLPDGTLYWRIRSTYEDFKVVSAGKAFEFKNVDRTPKPSPLPGAIVAARVPAGALGTPDSVENKVTPPAEVPEAEAPPPPPPVPSTTPSPVPSPVQFPTEAKMNGGAIYNPLTAKAPMEASWSAVKGAEGYEVSIYKELSLSAKLIQRLNTDQTHLAIKGLPPGDYSWTLRAQFKDARPTQLMPHTRFKISLGKLLAPPQVLSPEVQ
jgi:hypothetical protein